MTDTSLSVGKRYSIEKVYNDHLYGSVSKRPTGP